MAAYHAFMSYSTEADGALAPVLQRALEHLSKPWYSLRAGVRIFRDATDIAAAPQLEAVIFDGLARAEWLLLLASPSSARSRWVAKEVDWWLQNRSVQRLLIVRTSGIIRWDDAMRDFDWAVTDAIPPLLRGRLLAEPLFADITAAGALVQPDARSAALRDASVRIAACLLNRSPADIESDDIAQLRRNRAWAICAVGVIVLFAGAATALWRVAEGRADSLQHEVVRARVNELMAQAEAVGRSGQDDLSLALATHALETDPTNSAALLQSIITLGRLRALVTLRGHSAALESVVLSSDNRRTLTASMDGTARVWDSDSGRQLLVLDGHDGGSPHALFDRDAAHVLSSGTDGVVRWWDASNGKLLQMLVGHGSGAPSIAVSPTGVEAVTASGDQTVRRWRLTDGSETARLNLPAVPFSVAYARSGTQVLVACTDPIPRLWPSGSSRALELSPRGRRISAVRPMPDGGALFFSMDSVARWWNASGSLVREFGSQSMMDLGDVSADGLRIAGFGLTKRVINTWDTQSGAPGPTLHGEDSGLNLLRFGNRSDLIAATTDDDIVLVWNASNGHLVARLAGHRDKVTDLTMGGELAPLVATASADGTARLWQVYGAPLLHELRSRGRPFVNLWLVGPAGSLLIAGNDDGALAGWTLPDLSPAALDRVPSRAGRQTVPAPDGLHFFHIGTDGSGALLRADSTPTGQSTAGLESGGKQVAFSDDGHRMLTLHDAVVRVWDTDAIAPISIIDTGRLLVQSAALDASGRRLATCDADNEPAQLWDADSGRRVAVLGPTRSPCIPIFGPGGGSLMTIDEEGGTHWWDPNTGIPLFAARAHRGPVTGGAFSADGALAVTFGRDRTLRVWDVAGRRALSVLAGHGAEVVAAAFRGDGGMIVSASSDGSARVWHAATGQQLWVLDMDHQPLLDARFSPDGRQILTLSEDGALRIWDVALLQLPAAELLTRMNARIAALGIRLSSDQCQLYFDSSIGSRPRECTPRRRADP